jgi:HEPN domain-containing protein
LENALRGALKSVLGKDGGSDPRTSFYNKFKEEVAEHDEDLLKRHDEDLNTTLIFVSFSPLIESTYLTH